ncbi:MAG TPA: NADH-quinone oxidoreductase subunit M [Fibrobacteria bacterium]|nr:NADH-quinone oxidoreductase subunit M [Fibrobacteria bacterium]
MNLHLVLAAPFVAAILGFFLSGTDAKSAQRTSLVLALIIAGISFPLIGAGMIATKAVTWFSVPVVGTEIKWLLTSDGVSAWLVALLAALVPATLLAAPRIVGDRMREFATLVFLMQGCMTGAFLSGDLLMFFGFFEAMLIPSTVLIALFGGRDRRRAAMTFLLFSLAGSAPMFFSIWWIGLSCQTTELSVVATRLTSQLDPVFRPWLFGAIALAFLVKLPVVPFHLWQADAYSEGPAPASALLTGVMAKVGLFGVARILIPLFPVEAARFAGVFVAIGLVTVLVGALLALQQSEIRRVLAFSSLSHLGLGLAALFTFRPEAISGVLLLMVAHGLSAAALFFLAGIAETWTKSSHVDDFGALASRSPLFAVLFSLAALASIGLPGTAGFVAELLLLVSVFKVYGIWVAFAAGITLILSAAYTLRLVQRMLFGAPALPSTERQDLSVSEALGVAPILVALVLFGFYPSPVLKAARADLLTRLPVASAVATEDAAHVAGR